jgi:hypothetical protein
MRRLLLLLGLVLTSLAAAVPVASATTEPPSTEAPQADEDVVEEVVVDTEVPTTESTEVPTTTEPPATEIATTEAPTTEVSTTEIPATSIEAPTTTVAARATAAETAAVVPAAAALPYSVTVAEGCVDHGFGDEPVVNFTNTGTGTIVAGIGMAVRNVAPGETFEAWWPSAHGDLYPQFDWEAYELPDPMGEWGPVFATGTVYLVNACRVTTVPTAPRSLAAAPGASGQVKLTWLAPLSNGGSAITDYIVQRSTNATSGWTTIADGVRVTTGYTVTGLTNGTRYYFRVLAKNAAGNSPWSNTANAIPRPLPSAPRTLTAAPTNVSGRVRLSWLLPASNGGSAITDYIIQRSPNGTSSWVTINDGVRTTTTHTVTGLANGTRYYFRVFARNAAGTGAASNVANAIPRTRPSAPRTLTAAATTVSGQVRLSWLLPASNGGSAITDYIIQRSPNGTSSWVTVNDGVRTTTTYTVTGLTGGTRYHFRVQARNAAGIGAASNVVNAVPRR